MVKDAWLVAVLITGASGKLGSKLVKVFPGAICPTSRELDITDKDAVNKWVREHRPEMIIHAAALTGIRECEENKALAWKTNVSGTENLLGSCDDRSSKPYFVYVSTACVFFGDRGGYNEWDVPHPKNYYALSKLLGESAVRNSRVRWLIIRTNFVPREKWPYPAAFTDRFGTYLFADDLALAIKKVTEQEIVGIVHVCGTKKMSMFELARLTTREVKPMSISDYVGPPLTMDMSLKSSRIPSFDLSMRGLELAQSA